LRSATRKLSESATAIKVVGSKAAAFALLNFPQYPMQRYKAFHFSRSSIALRHGGFTERSLHAWQNESGIASR
jgi:hypothetical protein